MVLADPERRRLARLAEEPTDGVRVTVFSDPLHLLDPEGIHNAVTSRVCASPEDAFTTALDLLGMPIQPDPAP